MGPWVLDGIPPVTEIATHPLGVLAAQRVFGTLTAYLSCAAIAMPTRMEGDPTPIAIAWMRLNFIVNFSLLSYRQ